MHRKRQSSKPDIEVLNGSRQVDHRPNGCKREAGFSIPLFEDRFDPATYGESEASPSRGTVRLLSGLSPGKLGDPEGLTPGLFPSERREMPE